MIGCNSYTSTKYNKIKINIQKSYWLIIKIRFNKNSFIQIHFTKFIIKKGMDKIPGSVQQINAVQRKSSLIKAYFFNIIHETTD